MNNHAEQSRRKRMAMPAQVGRDYGCRFFSVLRIFFIRMWLVIAERFMKRVWINGSSNAAKPIKRIVLLSRKRLCSGSFIFQKFFKRSTPSDSWKRRNLLFRRGTDRSKDFRLVEFGWSLESRIFFGSIFFYFIFLTRIFAHTFAKIFN